MKLEAMKVIDHAPQWWYLLEGSGSVFVDVNCTHSFIGYCFTLQLNSDELANYRRDGRTFINTLASEIQDSAPILEASTSAFKGRDVSKIFSDEVAHAVERWRAASSGPAARLC